MKTELEVVVSAVLDALGFDLVELRAGGSKRRPVIDVRMERRDGEKVSVDDCASVSRVLGERLDSSVAGLGDYVLEVSSPGVERPLKKAADWRRFAGRTVSILSPAVGGRRELELIGLEGDDGSEVAVVKDAKGTEMRVPLAAIKDARLVFTWKR